jgi:hypothetical protein
MPFIRLTNTSQINMCKLQDCPMKFYLIDEYFTIFCNFWWFANAVIDNITNYVFSVKIVKCLLSFLILTVYCCWQDCSLQCSSNYDEFYIRSGFGQWISETMNLCMYVCMYVCMLLIISSWERFCFIAVISKYSIRTFLHFKALI